MWLRLCYALLLISPLLIRRMPTLTLIAIHKEHVLEAH